ncbi:MAG: hypothetical protein RMK62_04430, partial [Armatimonadota bacterium]|nr:hypothetical protein [Armatimonadota bacterium]
MQDALSIRSQLFNKNDQKSQIHLSNLGRVICIVGAPRSGTSILTHALSHLGVDLGSPEEMDGYMDSERQPFRDINIEIVRRIAISSLLPAQQILKDGWEKDQQFADLRQKAQEVIASQFKGKKLWGWKMPATT